MLKALLFDLDGTLIDSEFFHYECWNEILKESNVELTYDDWLKNYAGVPMPANAKNLIERYHIQTPLNDLIERRENLTLERLKTADVNLMPHVLDTIKFFYDKGLILAIVTSSPRKDVEAIFERNGLGKYFKLTITRSEVLKSKPDPESYNVCREQLGLAIDECLVFEDTINGVKSAKAANLICYAVQSNEKEHHSLSIADKLFLNFDEVKNYLVKSGQI
jgi:beta-phosphoglucomutase